MQFSTRLLIYVISFHGVGCLVALTEPNQTDFADKATLIIFTALMTP